MLLVLGVVATLEAAASPTVEVARTGSEATAVSAAPRTLSDVARELREGRKAVGGFSAVETTVPRVPVDLSSVEWEEERQTEPEVAREPAPPGEPWVEGWYGPWYGGGYGGAPKRRPPHVSHRKHVQAQAVPRPGVLRAPGPAPPSPGRPSARGGSRSAAAPLFGMHPGRGRGAS